MQEQIAGWRALGPERGLSLRHPVLLVVLLYVAAVLVWKWDWLWSGEMYAEMATNYFKFASSGDLGTALFARDAGYWPLPQRLLSGALVLLGVKAAATPFLYTMVAVLGAGLLAGSFAHPLFRPLLGCDATRAAASLMLLLSLDVETRGFINFTYLAVVPGAALAALVATRSDLRLPAWCWSLPLLTLSKPHVLTVVPLAAAAAVLGRGRGRLLMALTVGAGLVQVAVLAASRVQNPATDLLVDASLPLLTRVRDGIYYGFGLAGGDLAGPLSFEPGARRWLLCYGLLACVLAAALWWRTRRGEAALMAAGLALAVGTGLLNAFTLTVSWNASLTELTFHGIYRHRVTALAGAILAVAAACGLLAPRSRRLPLRALPLLVFAAWLFGTGSSLYPQLIQARAGFPLFGAGGWQNAAAAIDAGTPDTCVPIDPLGWDYARGCVLLRPVSWPTGAIPLVPGSPVSVPVPDPIPRFATLAVGVSVKPAVPGPRTVRLRASLDTPNGETVTAIADATLRPDGQQVLLTLPRGVSGSHVLVLDTDTPLLLFTAEQPARPVIAWFGK